MLRLVLVLLLLTPGAGQCSSRDSSRCICTSLTWQGIQQSPDLCIGEWECRAFAVIPESATSYRSCCTVSDCSFSPPISPPLPSSPSPTSPPPLPVVDAPDGITSALATADASGLLLPLEMYELKDPIASLFPTEGQRDITLEGAGATKTQVILSAQDAVLESQRTLQLYNVRLLTRPTGTPLQIRGSLMLGRGATVEVLAVRQRESLTLQSEAGGNQPERIWQAMPMKPLPKKCRPGAGGLAGVAVAIVALCGPHLLVSTPAARHATKIGNDGSIRVGPSACQRAEHLARCGPTRTRAVADKSPETAARAPDP